MDDPLSMTNLADISDTIRRLNLHVQHADGGDLCTKLANFIDSVHGSLTCDVGRHLDRWGHPFKILHLINACLIGSAIRSNADLRFVIEKSIAMVLPPHVASVVLQHLSTVSSSAGIIPSPSTLSRANLTLDVGFMAWWKANVIPSILSDDMCTASPIYLLCDSSPQGSRNWMLAEYSYLVEGHSARYVSVLANVERPEQVPLVQKAALVHNKLMEIRRRQEACSEQLNESDDSAGEDDNDIAVLTRIQASMFRVHLTPPMALGTRRAGLDDKLHCLMYSLHHEAGDLSTLRRLTHAVHRKT